MRTVEAMVAEQVGRWTQAQQAPRATGACVALSHLPGSHAEELGRRVAQRLDYGFFGREIVEAIGRDAGLERQMVAALDEHVRHVIDRYVVDAFRPHGFAESDYLKAVVRVLHTIAERGEAVVLGRGAAFILAPGQALRVLVVAPTEVRIERLAQRHGIDAAAAAKRLEREDADRAEFIRHHFGVRQSDPTRYELVVNTGSLSIEVAANVVVEALLGRFPRRGLGKAHSAVT